MKKDNKKISKLIAPFFWVDHENNFSVCLNVGEYKAKLFQNREEEGFEGNGYDWTSIAKVFLEEEMPELQGVIKFDPEAGMFCAYSSNEEYLKNFAIKFKDACENDQLIQDLFSRAELD